MSKIKKIDFAIVNLNAYPKIFLFWNKYFANDYVGMEKFLVTNNVMMEITKMETVAHQLAKYNSIFHAQ